ncbi:MAG: aryl-sulfate sulfotransferase [Chthoniobacterales bacterium]|nr:aryl-sulfate sulfotransferase [Chthoniobacterales bacterium]
MKICSLTVLVVLLSLSCDFARANQADNSTVAITAKNPGPTPFINQFTLVANDVSLIRSVQFTITPKVGSVTRPLSGTYSSDYLTGRGYLVTASNTIFLPVYGFYAGYANTVTLTYKFMDGSSKTATTTVTTPVYDDPCQYNTPTVLQARTKSTSLSYDFMLVRERCDTSSPTIIDSDSAVRWIGPAGISNITALLYDNAIYQAMGNSLLRIELDGTVTTLRNYADLNVTYFHHNIDRGKIGLILDADIPAYFESTNIEVDAAGNVLKVWNLADIVSAAMIAGGDDPSQFVFPSPKDWFHNNSVTYNRADDSLIISSRENFVICLDYETSKIKWILGDPTKEWYLFPSLRQYALSLPEGTNPPIGQHGVSIAYDQNLLLFDNAFASWAHTPKGSGRSYSSPRKYEIDATAKVATEIWNYPMDEKVFSALCGSAYEDAPSNYLIDYAYVYHYFTGEYKAQLLGLDAAGETVFYYEYPNVFSTCQQAYNSVPLHLESTKFPTVGPQALNISTRGLVSSSDDTLIGGFIVTGTESKQVALRLLGPSLVNSGVASPVANPVLTLFDAAGKLITTNDNWANDPAAAQLTAEGLAPKNSLEAATQQRLAPGTYTFVARSADSSSGVGLIEAYDLSPKPASRLANLSTRGFVGTGDDVLIGGFIVGDVANTNLVVRALGPSLTNFGVAGPLADPLLTIYDKDGSAIAANDNWQTDGHATDLQKKGLAPANAAESALILFLPAGTYSAVVTGTNAASGVGLVEFYDID